MLWIIMCFNFVFIYTYILGSAKTYILLDVYNKQNQVKILFCFKLQYPLVFLRVSLITIMYVFVLMLFYIYIYKNMSFVLNFTFLNMLCKFGGQLFEHRHTYRNVMNKFFFLCWINGNRKVFNNLLQKHQESQQQQ